MNVLVIGSGGREHALVRKLKESAKVDKLYCAPGNGGISKDAECVAIGAMEIDKMVTFAQQNNIHFAVVAPDDPLVAGMVDAFEAVGIHTFGPNKAAALLEGSKVFSKDLMKKYNIPTAGYEVFEQAADAIAYIETQNRYPTVVKADGLALGKGVIIAQNFEEAKDAVISIMEDKVFGASGSKLVVEEFLTGPEVSVLSFTDGKCVKPMISSMDHKRALDGDQGLNTGGMGTVAPNPYYTEVIAQECMDTVFMPTIEAMNQEGRPFKGCLYFGLMLTPKGIKVIEYNCRFGDPETQVVLPLLKTDLMDIFEAIHAEKLSEIDVAFSDETATCVVMASGGYPKSYPKDIEIKGLNEDGQLDDAIIYHAGTRFDDTFKTAGGRVLGVTAIGSDLTDALAKSYAAVEKISFDGAHYRKDIGQKALQAK